MSVVRDVSQADPSILRRPTADLAEFAWTEGAKFCRSRYLGKGDCAEPCDGCYQTALNFLIAEAQRVRRRDD